MIKSEPNGADDSVLSLPECTLCFDRYTENEGVRPFVGKCGHTVCQKCAVKVKNKDCPKCRKPKAFASPAVNYELMEHLTQQKKDREKISELIKEKDSRLEELDAENRRLRQIEKKVQEGPQFNGPNCSKCGYPMMNDAAFLCISCLDQRTKTEVCTGEFDDFNSLIAKVICGSCVLKYHKKHESEEFLALQVKRKAVMFKENLTRKVNATTHRIDILKGDHTLVGEIDVLFDGMKTNYTRVCTAMFDSPSPNEFEHREELLLNAIKEVDDEANTVIGSLYQLKYRIQNAVDISKQVIEALGAMNENQADLRMDSPRRGNARVKEEVPSPLPMDPETPGPSSRGMFVPEEYRPVTPVFLDDAGMNDNGAVSPSWPAYSASSPVIVGPGPESNFARPGPPARKRFRRETLEESSNNRVFKFLDLDQSTIRKLTPMIESLGGKVVPNGMFSPQEVTHVVCGKLAHSVNVLCLIAKGCWFLKTEYVTDCAELHDWLAECPYEWGNPNITETSALDFDEFLLVSTAQRWRNTLANSGWNTLGAFADWRVILYVSPEKCRKTLLPLLNSGGAVSVIRRSYPGSVADFAPTHVFVDDDPSWNKEELSWAVAIGAKVMIPEYIWNFLQSENINDEEYYHEDYRKLERKPF